MQLPFRRRPAEPLPAAAHQPEPAWSRLPAVEPTAGEFELTAPTASFVRSLTGRRVPELALAPLGHDVRLDAPGGTLVGVARAVEFSAVERSTLGLRPRRVRRLVQRVAQSIGRGDAPPPALDEVAGAAGDGDLELAVDADDVPATEPGIRPAPSGGGSAQTPHAAAAPSPRVPSKAGGDSQVQARSDGLVLAPRQAEAIVEEHSARAFAPAPPTRVLQAVERPVAPPRPLLSAPVVARRATVPDAPVRASVAEPVEPAAAPPLPPASPPFRVVRRVGLGAPVSGGAAAPTAAPTIQRRTESEPAPTPPTPGTSRAEPAVPATATEAAARSDEPGASPARLEEPPTATVDEAQPATGGETPQPLLPVVPVVMRATFEDPTVHRLQNDPAPPGDVSVEARPLRAPSADAAPERPVRAPEPAEPLVLRRVAQPQHEASLAGAASREAPQPGSPNDVAATHAGSGETPQPGSVNEVAATDAEEAAVASVSPATPSVAEPVSAELIVAALPQAVPAASVAPRLQREHAEAAARTGSAVRVGRPFAPLVAVRRIARLALQRSVVATLEPDRAAELPVTATVADTSELPVSSLPPRARGTSTTALPVVARASDVPEADAPAATLPLQQGGTLPVRDLRVEAVGQTGGGATLVAPPVGLQRRLTEAPRPRAEVAAVLPVARHAAVHGAPRSIPAAAIAEPLPTLALRPVASVQTAGAALVDAAPAPTVFRAAEVPAAHETPGPATVDATAAPETASAAHAPAAEHAQVAAHGGGGSAAVTENLDELAGRLYDRIRSRLRDELLIDRERAGLVTDIR